MSAPTPRPPPPQVAIVDDDESFRHALARLRSRVFISAGFRVESFADAASLLSGLVPPASAVAWKPEWR